MSDEPFDLLDLETLAKRLPPPVRTWTNPDTGGEKYLVIVHPSWFLRLSARDRWRMDRSRDRAMRRYGFPMLPEWAVGKLGAAMFGEDIRG